MNNRRFFLIGLFLSLLSFAHAEPKAYDLLKYRGKAGGVTIAFDFAHGYPEASELRVIEGRKTIKFAMENSDQMLYLPEKPPGGTVKSVTLKMDLEVMVAPDKVSGSYVAGGKTVRFTLTKRD